MSITSAHVEVGAKSKRLRWRPSTNSKLYVFESCSCSGWRRGPDDLIDILLPEGDDYKLVFISSDSSSKEEDVDDNDSSSTASSFPIDECDWDYFEPGGPRPTISWSSPFGSPGVCRRQRDSSDEDIDEERNERAMEEVAIKCAHQDAPQRQCKSCGAATQYIPIPVPVPIPFPVPWTPPPRFRVRNLWSYMSQAALIWPLINASTTSNFNSSSSMPVVSENSNVRANEEQIPSSPPLEVPNQDESDTEELSGYVQAEQKYSSTSESDTSACSDCDDDNNGDDNNKKRKIVHRVYNVNGDSRDSDDALPSSNVTSDCDDEDDGRHSQSSVPEDMSSTSSAETDSDDTGTVADKKPKRFSRTFVVNKNLSSSSSSNKSSSSDTDSSDNDTDTEMDCTVVLTNIKHFSEDVVYGDNNKTEEKEISAVEPQHDNFLSTCDNLKIAESSSPGLSDVSAESLSSSDVEPARTSSSLEDVNNVVKSEGEWIRSGEPVTKVGDSLNTRDDDGERAGALVTGEPDICISRHAARYTSLVMITQEPAPSYQQVSVVTSDTTTLVADNDVIVRHTNWQEKSADFDEELSSLSGK